MHSYNNMGVLSSGGVNCNFVENPAGYEPGGSGEFGNDSNAPSLRNQGLNPSGHLLNPFPSETWGVGPEGAIVTTPNASSNRPPGFRIYAVDVMTSTGTEPLCTVFNNQTDKSCIPATVAERLLHLPIQPTTPAQRRRCYSTPVGQVFSPQRYVELELKACDPFIPPVRLTVLLLEGDGPIDGVHLYLGRAVFSKAAEQQSTLTVLGFDYARQRTGVGPMNWTMGPNGITGMSGKRVVVLLQNNMKLTSIKVFPGPAPSAYSGDASPSNRSHFGLSSFTTRLGPSPLSCSNFSDTMSAKTSIFSEPSWRPSTISSLDSTVAPSNAIVEFMKNTAFDVFFGYAGLGSAAHDGDLDSNTIDPAMLSNPSQVLLD